jgi:diaminopimelate decarboxylase
VIDFICENIAYNSDGELCVEDVPVDQIVREHGTPLFITSAAQIRQNYRRFYAAFADRYPSVHIHFAIKANNNLAIRRILTQEGAGGECFGMGELWATLQGGTDPAHTVINGSNKSTEEIYAAIEAGVTLNIDATDELDRIQDACKQLNRRATVSFRVKPFIESLKDVPGPGSYKSIAEIPVDVKWGLTTDTICAMIEQAQADPLIDLNGFSFHLGRKTTDVTVFGRAAAGVVDFIAQVRDRTGFTAKSIDLGGGYAHHRDPEGGVQNAQAPEIEAYAEAICSSIIETLDAHDLGRPTLILEPGRNLVGNTTLLIGSVGAVKEYAPRMPWVHLDVSTNHLMRILTAGYYHHTVPVRRSAADELRDVQIVGPNCSPDVLEPTVQMPALKRGDLVAVLDAGMYAETNANQFNGIPRPATVLVSGSNVDIIKERETVEDVFAKQRVPSWLDAAPVGVAGDE